MAINVRSIANNATKTVNSNELVTLYVSLGQVNIKGIVKPNYLEPVEVEAQVQSLSAAELKHLEKVGQSNITRRMFVNVEGIVPQGLVRQSQRGGDLIKRADGTYWLATAVPYDFSASSKWVELEITLQTIEPDFTHLDWFGG